MAQMKLLILIANLLLLRLVASAASSAPEPKQTEALGQTNSSNHNYDSSILDQINSLDFSASEQTESSTGKARQTLQQEHFARDETAERKESPSEGYTNSANGAQESRPRRAGKSTAGSRKRQSGAAGPANFGQLLLNLLGQLEKVDVRGLISSSLQQVGSSQARSSSGQPALRRSAANSNGTSPRERVNASSISAEAGNLLSVTQQLVKLARSQVLGGDFSSWLSPMTMPSMLSAASHMMHDSNDFTSASLKSDWFWVVAPAVIVIGAGVIVVPLIAAWLVSHMMNQNTFTVSAGRRRRRRHAGQLSRQTSSAASHQDLFKLLDIHRLLDDPELLVDKLGRFHKALESVGSQLRHLGSNSKEES